ncbi:hypothetical protein R8Z50_23310 [Longispora sp. K20-0274]|uniref:hypothetical protein n=1 Tax=Longispora sp. K20-0274 TaxID=3088255 RepID=UPI00399B3E09
MISAESRSATTVRFTMLGLAAVLLADAAATYLVVTPEVTDRIGLAQASGLSTPERVADLRTQLLLNALPYALFALAYLALVPLVARRALRTATLPLCGFVALWISVAQLLPWLGFGSLTNPDPGPGQVDWTVIAEAVPGWYAPTSLALFVAELALLVAVITTTARRRRSA